MWDKYFVPLAGGLNTKADPRALPPPGLSVCKNAEFDELGGVQTRKPFASLGTNIKGGGTLADVRKVVPNGDELLVFTKDKLYSWSAYDTAWVEKATYLAPKLTESSVFVNTAEQKACDRAELGGVIVYAWEETRGSTTTLHAAAKDAVTGAVLMAPKTIASGFSRPRLLAMGDHFLIFSNNAAANTLWVGSIDPANLSTSFDTIDEAEVTTAFNEYYDVVKVSDTEAVAVARRDVTTSYTVAHISCTGPTAVPVVTEVIKARTCDGPIAVSKAPSSANVQVVRANGTNIQGDFLTATSALTDVYTNQAVGTASGTVNQIAAAHRSVLEGAQNRCYVFWSAGETSGATDFSAKYNWVDTGNTLGTEAVFVHRLGVASRAFDHDGRVYVWAAFASESSFSGANSSGFRAALQNTYFLYRDDALLVAKAAAHRAGGFSQTTGHLPHVQSLGSNAYAWCGVERRVVPVGVNQSSYAARSPRDIRVEFDSDDARRTARLGKVLYVVGGEVLQYDGETLVEVGFHVFPWYFGAIELSSAGAVENGTYALKVTWRWDNAKGERDRSTTATHGDVAITAGPNSIQIPTWQPLNVTHKNAIAAEVWRTLKNPSLDAPFYLVTSQDPSVTTGTNAYVENDASLDDLAVFEDALADSDVASKEINPENGGVLENLAPPACSLIVATQDRLFLAGISDNPYQVWYSKLRGDGEVAAFHDALTVELPPAGGDITALAFLNDTLIVFCERGIYALPGEGFDNLGGGQNYGPARLLASDIGAVNAESVCLTPSGLVFKSSKGWYLLSGAQAPQYIGAAVAEFDSDTVVAAHVVESQHQVRILTTSRMLVWDYLVNEWSEWTIASGKGACMWQGKHVYCTATDVLKESDFATTQTNYALDVELAWLVPAGAMGRFLLRQIHLLGEFRSACDMRIRVAKDYKETDAAGPTWFDDRYRSVSPTDVGGPLQFRHGPKETKMEAVKIRLTPYAVGSTTNPPTGEAVRLTGLMLEMRPQRGAFRGLNNTQRQ